MYRNQPRSLAELVSEYIEEYSDRNAMGRGIILLRWRDVVGNLIADQCKSVRFDAKNRFIMSVPNPAWRHEIHMQRTHIRNQLNKEAKSTVITEIVVRS